MKSLKNKEKINRCINLYYDNQVFAFIYNTTKITHCNNILLVQ